MMTNDGAPYRESEIAEGEPDGEMSIEEWCVQAAEERLAELERSSSGLGLRQGGLYVWFSRWAWPIRCSFCLSINSSPERSGNLSYKLSKRVRQIFRSFSVLEAVQNESRMRRLLEEQFELKGERKDKGS